MMPVCELCGEKKEVVYTCRVCRSEFCEDCGDPISLVCSDCGEDVESTEQAVIEEE